MQTDSKALVLAATDIVALISESVALKRRGKDFLGLCPFHTEKTASFSVSPGKQLFYCQGCKVGGTVFDFVMKRDRVDFRGALEVLAKRANIDLPKVGGMKAGERQTLLDAHSAAALFFENSLGLDGGKEARLYLERRGFSAESLKAFRIGLAPEGWDGMQKSAYLRKFDSKALLAAGLVKARESGAGFYDTFRDRIMFPIRDESGRIIAFGGRVMPGGKDPAKYLNSPETALFSKGRTIFGLDAARAKIVESRTAAVVEGYTDVVMAHQYGATNVVSVLGTAMTEHHVTILRRYADRIVLLFDADAAGDLAVARVVQLFLSQPVEIAVASMPVGLDPDEFLMKEGVEAFKKTLSSAPDALEFAWRATARKYELANGLTDQQSAAREFLELLGEARKVGAIDPMRWGPALARVSRLTSLPMGDLEKHFKKGAAKARSQKFGVQRGVSGPVGEDFGEVERVERGVGMTAAQNKAETWLLGVLLLEPGKWAGLQGVVSAADFEDPVRRRLAEIYWHHQQDEGEPVLNEFMAELGEEEIRRLALEIIEEVERFSDLGITLSSALEQLAESRRRREERKTSMGTSGANMKPEELQVDLLRQLSQKAGRPNLRRTGF